MGKAAQFGTAMVAAHSVALVLHSTTHARLAIWPTAGEKVFIASVIVVAPLISAVLLWTRLRLVGAWLLLGSMAGSLAFGIYKHFIVPSPDHVLHVAAGKWGSLFGLSAVLLAIAEALGCWAGARALRAWQRNS